MPKTKTAAIRYRINQELSSTMQKNKGTRNSYTKSTTNALHCGQQPGTSFNRQLMEISNFIEQVTDFKYLSYRIAEYKIDLEDKLQKCNKINGAIRRHFGKPMNKETI